MPYESSTTCVVKPNTGEPSRFVGKEPKEFIEHIKNADFAWVNIQVKDLQKQGPSIVSQLGFTPSLVSNLLEEEFSGDHDLGNELGLEFPAVYVKNFEVHVQKIIILLKDNVILTLHDKSLVRLVKFSRYATTFFKKISKDTKVQDKITNVLIRILDENNERNFDGIRKIQELGEVLSKHLIEPGKEKQKLGENIYKMKSALLTYMETLWASLDVIQYLRYGDPDQLTDDPKILQQIGLLGSDVTMQISISEQMSNVLASGLEVLQSIYNNELQKLNNRMSIIVVWLTILGTAVMVPNTIATIFGVAPIAEQLSWQMMSWIIGLSTILSVIIVVILIKRKKIFPNSENN